MLEARTRKNTNVPLLRTFRPTSMFTKLDFPALDRPTNSTSCNGIDRETCADTLPPLVDDGAPIGTGVSLGIGGGSRAMLLAAPSRTTSLTKALAKNS